MKTYLRPKSKIITIVANGTFPADNFLLKLRKVSDLIIACDGAIERLLKKKIKPDIVIGDFDSIKSKNLSNIKTLKITEQETTDLEKAIKYIKDKRLTFYTLFLAGCLGKREDFSLYNLHLLTRFADKRVVLIDKNFFVFSIKKFFRLSNVKLNVRTSILPVETSFIKESDGFYYDLTGLCLKYGKKESISNVVNKKDLLIKISSGKVLLFIDINSLNGELPWVK